VTGSALGMRLIGLANLVLNATRLGDQLLVCAQRPKERADPMPMSTPISTSLP
jgi:hypothetical protein